jgi:predicted DCC family thiol-disulfide oxidoreductase YuxK
MRPKLREQLFRAYFVVDPRSLGLFRIVFGVTLLCDLWLRYCAVDEFYTNQGLLPNHTLLWAPPASRMLSFFFTASSRGQAVLMMSLCAAAFSMLLVGYRTKLAQLASILCLVSMNTRLASLENGGDMVMNLLAIWTLALPLGRRFSIDALRSSLAARSESRAHELLDRSALRGDTQGYASLAMLAMILQFSLSYYFNVVHKTGPTWSEGTAVHYTLHQDRLIKALGVWLREHLPFEVTRVLTYATIVIESLGVLAIASPVLTKYTRALAVLLMPGLHLGFELCLDLGVFSFAMMSFFPLLLLPAHWNWLSSVFARMHRKRLVFFDADCGVCLWCVRVLARLDRFERLELIENTDQARLPAGVDPALLDTTILVVDAETRRTYTRATAFAQLLRSLPCGFLLALPLQLPGCSQLAGVCYDRVAASRARISVFFGLAACGVPRAPSPTAAVTTHAAVFGARSRRVLGEGFVALMMIAVTGDVVNSNSAVPKALRYRQPALLQALVEYPRVFQGWRMFAPHAPTEDFNIEIDATTVDGRHVDPYNEVASRVRGPGLEELKLLQQNQFFTAYSLFIWRDGFRAYRTAFQEWILRYHERTGNPRDRIVRYTVYKLSDSSPAPHKTANTNFKREAFMRYPL